MHTFFIVLSSVLAIMMAFSIMILMRNNIVFRSRMKMLDRIREAAKQDAENGRE